MEQQLYSAQTVVKLFYLSWRLVVAKHLGTKVLLFSLSFVFLCLSAQPWWLLLLMLSASFFLVVFSPNKPPLLLPETLNTSFPVHQSIFRQEDLPGFTRPWWCGYMWNRMGFQQTATLVLGGSIWTEQSSNDFYTQCIFVVFRIMAPLHSILHSHNFFPVSN